MPSYAEMKKQLAELEKQAAKQRKSEIKDVLATIKSLMKKHGITAADLGFFQLGDKAAGPRKRLKKAPKSKSPAKYRDPATGLTWSGHGRAPGWILLARANKTIDALLIEKKVAAKATTPKKASGSVPSKTQTKSRKAGAKAK